MKNECDLIIPPHPRIVKGVRRYEREVFYMNDEDVVYAEYKLKNQAPSPQQRPSLRCPRCGSTNVKIQAISKVSTTKRKGCAYWIFIGWWLEPLLWIFLTLPKLIYELLRSGKTKTKIVTMAICQGCGYNWKTK